MSNAIAVKAITTLAPIALSKAVEMKNANKQAEITLDQQQRQAKNDLIIGVAPHVVQLANECVKARATLQQVQQESQRIELQRETMQRQAEIDKQAAADRHAQNMSKLNQMGENYKQAIQANQQASSEVKHSLDNKDHLIAQALSAMLQPELDNETKKLIAQELQRLHADETQLIEEHARINSQSHSAFIHSCDAHFESPRTFTDVG